METHKTLESARQAAASNSDIRHIIEIEHAAEGRCYIGCKAAMSVLANAIKSRPLPGVTRLIAEHAVERVAAPLSLREQRRQLAENFAAALDEEQARKDHAWERGDEQAACTPRNVKVDAAGAALDAFDAAHPEVMIEIERERNARVQRFLDAGF